MDCPICNVTYTPLHLPCVETYIDYPDNSVVQSAISRHPDVFEFLLTVLQSQSATPVRFRPVPTWFALRPQADAATITALAAATTESLMDLGRFRRALERIDMAAWRALDCAADAELMQRVDLDAYMLARFMVLSCPLVLEGVQRALGATTAWHQYRVTWTAAEEQRWERAGAGQTPEYLYHGSPLSNWQSILRTGLRVTSRTTWMSSGAAYGEGIYCSNQLSMSWGYCRGTAIVIGVYEVWDAARYLKSPQIFVVPGEELLMLRYLIYMPNSTAANIAALDMNLREEWLVRGTRAADAARRKNARIETRLRREVEEIERAGMQVVQWDLCRIEVNNAGKTIIIEIPHQFPFAAPTVAGREVADWTPRRSLFSSL